MLDSDLARLYGVPTKALNPAVQRNIERFREDFIFQLTWEEMDNLFVVLQIIDNECVSDLKSQFVTSSLKDIYNHKVIENQHGGKRKLPYAFTEQRVAMLSSVLQSARAASDG